MKGQWGLILSLLGAILIAIFAVINVSAVRVNYLFGTAESPLILVILISVFMGAFIAGAFGTVRIYRLQSEIKHLKSEQQSKETVELIEENDQTEEPILGRRYKKETNE